MKEYWAEVGESPTFFRYVDWILTVPLMCVEFYLITKKQYYAAYNLFQEYEELLKERLKPLWYALMHLMRDEFPDEYLRMPAEMAETVQEILEKVKETTEK